MTNHFFLGETIQNILEKFKDIKDIILKQPNKKAILLEMNDDTHIFLSWDERDSIKKYIGKFKDIKILTTWCYRGDEFYYFDYVSLKDILNNQVEPPQIEDEFHPDLWELYIDYDIHQISNLILFNNNKDNPIHFTDTLDTFMPKKVFQVFKKYLHHQPLDHKVIKLQEELGELSQAYLKYIGSLNSTDNEKYQNYKTLLEEIVDLLLVIFDVLYKVSLENNIEHNEIYELFLNKINKFEKKMEKRTDKNFSKKEE